jgi:hypothetical protein
MDLLKLAVYLPIAAVLLFFVYLAMGWFGIVIAVAGAALKYAVEWQPGSGQRSGEAGEERHY